MESCLTKTDIRIPVDSCRHASSLHLAVRLKRHVVCHMPVLLATLDGTQTHMESACIGCGTPRRPTKYFLSLALWQGLHWQHCHAASKSCTIFTVSSKGYR